MRALLLLVVLASAPAIAAPVLPRGADSLPVLQPLPPGGLPVVDVHVFDTEERDEAGWVAIQALVKKQLELLNTLWISQQGERFVTFRLKGITRRADVLAADCEVSRRIAAGDPTWMRAMDACSDPRVRDPAAMNVALKFRWKMDHASFGRRIAGKPFVGLQPGHFEDISIWIHEFGHALGGLPHACSHPRPAGAGWNVMSDGRKCEARDLQTGFFFTDRQVKQIHATVKRALALFPRPEPARRTPPTGTPELDVHFAVLDDAGLDDGALEELLESKVEMLNRTFVSRSGVPAFHLRLKGFGPPSVAATTPCVAVAKQAAGEAKWTTALADCKDPRVRDVTALNVIVFRPAVKGDEPTRGARAHDRPHVTLNVADLENDGVLAREVGRAFGLVESCGDGEPSGLNVMETPAACRKEQARTPGGPLEDIQAETVRREAREFLTIVAASRRKGSDQLPAGLPTEDELRQADDGAAPE